MSARAASLVVALVLVGLPPAPSLAYGQGLDILLTNDDGYDGEGIRVLRDALVDAGHSVMIVAPADNRSGSGTSITTSGTIDYVQEEAGVWAVDGTPSDAVTLGLVHILRDQPPDLVVSGANFGQNVGASVLASGTVGAALTAARSGIPALAVSVAIDMDEAEGPAPFTSTRAAFAPAAALVVEIVRQLEETGGGGLLPPRTVLNINYPAVGGAEPAGVRFATVSRQRGFRQVYSVAGESGPARVRLVPSDVTEADDDSDLALLAEGFATISVLDGDWDVGREGWERLLERLVIER